MFDCVIVDDQEDGLELLADYVNQTSLLSLEKTFLSPVQAMEYVKENPVDLIFLDVEMPLMNGIEFANLLDEYYSPFQGPSLIFSTAYRNFAVDSYDFQRCIGYLLKPYTYSKFLKFVQRLEIRNGRKVAQEDKRESQKLVLERRRKEVVIDIDDILYVTGSKNSVIVALSNGRDERFYMAFHQIEKLLPEDLFVRIHKSHIVAIRKIESISNDTIRLSDLRVNFPIGITYRDHVHQITRS